MDSAKESKPLLRLTQVSGDIGLQPKNQTTVATEDYTISALVRWTRPTVLKLQLNCAPSRSLAWCTEPCSDGVFIWCQLSNRFVQRDAASATSISTLANVPEKSVTTTSNRLRMLPPATPDLACFQALRVAHPEGVQLHLHSSRGGRPLPSEQR